jgi:hypothetical protein
LAECPSSKSEPEEIALDVSERDPTVRVVTRLLLLVPPIERVPVVVVPNQPTVPVDVSVPMLIVVDLMVLLTEPRLSVPEVPPLVPTDRVGAVMVLVPAKVTVA